MPEQLFFLPGALGRTQLWQPVAQQLHPGIKQVHFGRPGFAGLAPDSAVQGIDDLVSRVLAELDRPSALIAQSMGGVIALKVALAKPELIIHLVLAVTSGGLDVAALGAEDWREGLHQAHPHLPRWFSSYWEDLSAQLPRLTMPALLLWGDADPISPMAVGQRLAALLPQSQLQILPGADHDLAESHAEIVAPLIARHLGLPTG